MTNPLDGQAWRDFYARHRGKLWLAQTLVVFILGVVFAWSVRGPAKSPERSSAETNGSAVDSGPTTWTCSMHPQIRQPNTGKCPICGMDLIPVAKSTGGLRTLNISPESRALMDIETAQVERQYVQHSIRMVGKVDYDETKLGYITAWVAGRLDRLYVDFTGIEVKKGDHMVYIFSEELYAAQEELIGALKYSRERRANTTARLGVSNLNLVESAREKLRLLGLNEEQIREIETRDKPANHVTIYSPVGGIVIDKLRQEGERVKLGDRIYTIADLTQVWVHLDAYETDLPWIRYGQDVTVTTEAYPGEKFHGRIAFIQPVLNDKTRTVKVRVNVPNAEGKLKPEMFVHATVRPQVASGGKVMDPALAGKWISPMHPEIVKDEPGSCDICGMPLVRAESLGYVTATTDQQERPLVIPHLAALVTGTRAVVYVELPNMHSAAEPAMQTLSAIIQQSKLDKIREAFATYGSMLDRPYDQPGTDYARRLWNEYADRLGRAALAGQQASSLKVVEAAYREIESTMNDAREQFAPPGQPTYEGREIVLGPRAGDYYIVRNGLQQGQLVVTQGNFKIDAEIQIQAKPSMMTPDGGGGGGGHDHGGQGAATKSSDHATHSTSLPVEFAEQVRNLESAYQQVTNAVNEADVRNINLAFNEFGSALSTVDGNLLSGHPRMLWKEFSMLLGNDAVEGGYTEQLAEAQRLYLLLKGHMRRMREQIGVSDQPERPIERIAVSPEFQAELARLWQTYLPIQQALAADDYAQARQALNGLETQVAAINDQSLNDAGLNDVAQTVWKRELRNLGKLIEQLKQVDDIKALRTEFAPLSQEVGVLAKTFGFGAAHPVFEIHCPMALQGLGASWYQDNDKVSNPYFGSTMLRCADRVEQLTSDPSTTPPDQDSHPSHAHH